jgi:hypothetical protein
MENKKKHLLNICEKMYVVFQKILFGSYPYKKHWDHKTVSDV